MPDTRVVALLGLLACPAAAQTFAFDSVANLKPHRVNIEPATYKGKKAVRATPAPGARGEGLIILEGTEFQDGVIEAEIAGMPGAGAAEAARGFVGVAFRVASPEAFEAFYLRPTNGRAEDQVRRNHSAQYISHPEFPWMRLRKEFPEMYESYVDLVPGEWTKVRIEVRGVKARLYVHGNAQPTLIVNDLKRGESKGAVALWSGSGTEAHFASLKITK